jgi:hypothetical protein
VLGRTGKQEVIVLLPQLRVCEAPVSAHTLKWTSLPPGDRARNEERRNTRQVGPGERAFVAETVQFLW